MRLAVFHDVLCLHSASAFSLSDSIFLHHSLLHLPSFIFHLFPCSFMIHCLWFAPPAPCSFCLTEQCSTFVPDISAGHPSLGLFPFKDCLQKQTSKARRCERNMKSGLFPFTSPSLNALFTKMESIVCHQNKHLQNVKYYRKGTAWIYECFTVFSLLLTLPAHQHSIQQLRSLQQFLPTRQNE